MSKQFYITTAIDYVNGQPHLGHAYEKVITDVIARAHESLGEGGFYLTGLDEHGQKVEQAASEAGMDSRAYCDQLAGDWIAFAGRLNLSNGDFIRTTEERHRKVVHAVLQKLQDTGHLYRAEYRGFYSPRQEMFLTDRDRNEDGTFDEQYGEVIELVEDNYYFKMGEHQEWILEFINQNPDFIRPDYRRNEILGFLNSQDLGDLCISRPKDRLSWGIPLPFDRDYVTYVWFDALTNYITVPAAHGDPGILEPLGLKPGDFGVSGAEAKSLWPADIHVIGKDILRFHAVYWPIMLKCAGLPLPKQVLVHGWWQKNGRKIAKSTGNIVDPMAVIEEWGLDAFRFYVVRELEIGPDGNWTDEGFAARYQSELANGLGNLINRSLKMLQRYRDGVVPARSDERLEETRKGVDEVKQLLGANRLQASLRHIWELVTAANQYVDRTEPFKLAKDPSQAGRLDEVLYNLVETCRILAVLVWPFLPTTGDNIFRQLNLGESPNRLALTEWGGMQQGHTIGEVFALFPRKEMSKHETKS